MARKKKEQNKEQEVELVEKTKRRILRSPWFYVTIGVIITLLVIAFLSLNIKFVLRDEINIGLSVNQTSFSIQNKDSAHVEVTLENNNFLECSASCSLSVYDIRDQNITILFNESFTMRHKEKLSKEYVLFPPDNGHGQSIYQVRAQCSNIQTLICRTSGKIREVTQPIFVNYVLSEQEELVLSEYKETVENYTSLVNTIYVKQKQNDILLDDAPITPEYSALKNNHNTLEKDVNSYVLHGRRVARQWNTQNFSLLPEMLAPSIIEQAFDVLNSVTTLQDSILRSFEFRSNSVAIIKQILNHMQDTQSVENWARKYPSLRSNEILSKIHSSLQGVQDQLSHLLYSSSSTDESIHAALIAYNISLSQEVYSYQQIMDAVDASVVYAKELVSISTGSVIGVNATSCESLVSLQSAIDTRNTQILQQLVQNNLTPNDFSFEQKKLHALALERISSTNASLSLVSLIQSERSRLGLQNTSVDVNNSALDFIMIDDTLIDDTVNNYCSVTEQRLPSLVQQIRSALSQGIALVTVPSQEITLVSSMDGLSLNDPQPICCAYGKCTACCIDCEKTVSEYPVLFIHGHGVDPANTPEYSMTIFTKVQKKMESEGYINGGELDLRIDPQEVPYGLWGQMRAPVTFRATYYYISHLGIGGYEVTAQKSERIENYAIRLAETVNLVKQLTGSPKVHIVAHSMGGLVVRQYLTLFGADSVGTIVTVNSPHHGISSSVYRACSFLSASKECDDMLEESIFLRRLNSFSIPNADQFYVIRSVGCAMGNVTGDGVVTNQSGYLSGVQNYVLEGSCTDTFNTNLHSNVLDPELYPESYDLLLSILKNSS